MIVNYSRIIKKQVGEGFNSIAQPFILRERLLDTGWSETFEMARAEFVKYKPSLFF